MLLCKSRLGSCGVITCLASQRQAERTGPNRNRTRPEPMSRAERNRTDPDRNEDGIESEQPNRTEPIRAGDDLNVTGTQPWARSVTSIQAGMEKKRNRPGKALVVPFRFPETKFQDDSGKQAHRCYCCCCCSTRNQITPSPSEGKRVSVDRDIESVRAH